MIKAVFFDLYGTLARFWPPREETQARAAARLGLAVERDGIVKGYAAADDLMASENARSPVFRRNAQGQLDFFAEYERLVLAGAGVEATRELALQMWDMVRSTPSDLALFEDALPAVQALKERGLALGIITNLNRDLTALLRRLGLAPYIDVAVSSAEAEVEKPHPAIFLAALSKAGVRPEQALHVGDQISSDVAGALAVGMHALLLDREGMIERDTACPRISTLAEVVEHLNAAE